MFDYHDRTIGAARIRTCSTVKHCPTSVRQINAPEPENWIIMNIRMKSVNQRQNLFQFKTPENLTLHVTDILY